MYAPIGDTDLAICDGELGNHAIAIEQMYLPGRKRQKVCGLITPST